MKKKISLVLAFLMAATMLAGCKKTDEDAAGLPEVTSESISLTQMTTETTTEAVEETTETTEESTEETTEEVTEETSETTEETTTAASETTTASTTTATTVTTKAAAEWNETEISETLYIKTSCYSRKKAVVGSESVKKYSAGTKINVVAATDTGYYKLADGTFIHSDYVTDEKPAETTTAATTAKKDESNPDDNKTTTTVKINSSYNKDYTTRYPYKQLSSSEKQLYQNIVEAAYSFNTTVAVPDGLVYEDIFKVYCMVFNQEPQLFWLSSSVPRGYGSIELEYVFSADEVQDIQDEIDSATKQVMAKVGGYSSTVSKLKVIYDWVITNNSFAESGGVNTLSVYNGLGGGSGGLQCQGYAKTVQYLCDVAGIECMVVNGNNAQGSTHAWNIVYCDNGYYILDATWGDPITTYGRSSYVRYLFFLANDDMIENTHLNVSTMLIKSTGSRIKIYDPPACTKSACYYFKAYNKEYSTEKSAEEAMYAEIKAAVEAGKNVAHIKVTDHDLWETMRSNSYWKKYQDYAKSLDSDVKELKRQTSLTEDVLVVEFDIVYK